MYGNDRAAIKMKYFLIYSC